MATANIKANKKASVAIELPECPVCLDTLSIPIYQCQGGHSLCSTCTAILTPPICPVCRQLMTQMRNFTLEDIVSKAKVPCPNKSAGCVYQINTHSIDEHLKECIFRVMECPVGTVFGRCSWNGRLKELMDHFKDRHAEHCNVSSDTEVELSNFDVNVDDRFLFLITQGKFHFILTIKIDSLQKMAYWTTQMIGGKHTAQQHIYEIHVTSKLDPRRKVVFIEHCFNDAIKSDEVFRQSKCAMVPLDMLKHYVKDRKLSFRFLLKRVAPAIKKGEGQPKKATANYNNPTNNPDTPRSSGPINVNSHIPPKFKGVHPGQGPRGSGPKGPGPKKQFKAQR